MEVDAVDGERRPVAGQPWPDREAVDAGFEAEKALQHHLRHENALEKLAVEPEAASRAAALHRASAGLSVIVAVAPRLSHLGIPTEDLP